jgi:hypothetical protein
MSIHFRIAPKPDVNSTPGCAQRTVATGHFPTHAAQHLSVRQQLTTIAMAGSAEIKISAQQLYWPASPSNETGNQSRGILQSHSLTIQAQRFDAILLSALQ